MKQKNDSESEVYMCVYVCNIRLICIYILHMCVNAHSHASTYLCIYMCMYIHTICYTRIQTHTLTYTHTYTHTYIHTTAFKAA